MCVREGERSKMADGNRSSVSLKVYNMSEFKRGRRERNSTNWKTIEIARKSCFLYAKRKGKLLQT